MQVLYIRFFFFFFTNVTFETQSKRMMQFYLLQEDCIKTLYLAPFILLFNFMQGFFSILN